VKEDVVALQGQRVVVIGGTSGIGLETAKAARALGAEVTVVGRDQDKLQAALDALGDGASGVPVDASDRGALERFFERVRQLDHLVLAAGGAAGAGPIASLDLGELRAGFEAKLFPHLSALQLALPRLDDAGSVTFVASASPNAPYVGVAGLSAINGALEAIVPGLAVELKPIRVNVISPGVIDTPWWRGLPEEDRHAVFSQYGAAAPVGRIGAPEEVAQAIVAVMSNGFITGTVLTIDGGLRYTVAA
jgi:NAD(P)-dependent dehydrogenase (short-subunit alcohol dehydrogenase family)